MVRLELERTLEVRQRVFHGVAPAAPHPDPVANVRPLQLAPAARRELRQRGRPRLPDRRLVRTARVEVEGPRRREFERQAVVGVPLGVLDEARRVRLSQGEEAEDARPGAVSGVAEVFADASLGEPRLDAAEVERARRRPADEQQVLADIPHRGRRKHALKGLQDHPQIDGAENIKLDPMYNASALYYVQT